VVAEGLTGNVLKGELAQQEKENLAHFLWLNLARI